MDQRCVKMLDDILQDVESAGIPQDVKLRAIINIRKMKFHPSYWNNVGFFYEPELPHQIQYAFDWVATDLGYEFWAELQTEIYGGVDEL